MRATKGISACFVCTCIDGSEYFRNNDNGIVVHLDGEVMIRNRRRLGRDWKIPFPPRPHRRDLGKSEDYFRYGRSRFLENKWPQTSVFTLIKYYSRFLGSILVFPWCCVHVFEY